MLLFRYRVKSDDEHSSFALEIIYCIIKSRKLDSINEKFQSKDIIQKGVRYSTLNKFFFFYYIPATEEQGSIVPFLGNWIFLLMRLQKIGCEKISYSDLEPIILSLLKSNKH